MVAARVLTFAAVALSVVVASLLFIRPPYASGWSKTIKNCSGKRSEDVAYAADLNLMTKLGTTSRLVQLTDDQATVSDILEHLSKYQALVLVTAGRGGLTRRTEDQPFISIAPNAMSTSVYGPSDPGLAALAGPLSLMNGAAAAVERILGRRLFPITVSLFDREQAPSGGPYAIFDASAGTLLLDRQLVSYTWSYDKPEVSYLTSQLAGRVFQQVASLLPTLQYGGYGGFHAGGAVGGGSGGGDASVGRGSARGREQAAADDEQAAAAGGASASAAETAAAESAGATANAGADRTAVSGGVGPGVSTGEASTGGDTTAAALRRHLLAGSGEAEPNAARAAEQLLARQVVEEKDEGDGGVGTAASPGSTADADAQQASPASPSSAALHLLAAALAAALPAAFSSAPPLWFCILCPSVLGLLAPVLINLALNQLAGALCAQMHLTDDACFDVLLGALGAGFVLSLASAVPIFFVCRLPQCAGKNVTAALRQAVWR